MNGISVIIPALNEARYLSTTIETLYARAQRPRELEVIIVDTGSTDGTLAVARRYPFKLLELNGPIGRAHALNAGAAATTGNILMFLDADCLVPQDFDRHIRASLRDPKTVGGAFEFALEGPEFGLRFVEAMNRLRYRIRPRFFGDQGIFVRRDVFQHCGGYPPVPLMEASHFCRAAAKFGRLKLLSPKIVTSARRFREGGIYRVFWRSFKIWALDLLGYSTERLAPGYWQYNRPKQSV